MAARLPRPGSLLTGHRTKKTKHLSQQKQWTKEKRPKEEPIEAEEAPAEKEQDGGDNNSDNSSTHEAQPKVQPKKPKQGKKKAKLDPFVRAHYPAAPDELQALQEMDTNIFSLEVVEVLKYVRVDYVHLEPMEKALHSLRSTPPLALRSSDLTRLCRDVDAAGGSQRTAHLPLRFSSFQIDLEDEVPACLQLQNGKQSQIKFRFKHPRSVKLAGSYALHTVASADPNLDLAVEIPSVRSPHTA